MARADRLLGVDDGCDDQEPDVRFEELDSKSESESETQADQEKDIESDRMGSEAIDLGGLLGGATPYTH